MVLDENDCKKRPRGFIKTPIVLKPENIAIKNWCENLNANSERAVHRMRAGCMNGALSLSGRKVSPHLMQRRLLPTRLANSRTRSHE